MGVEKSVTRPERGEALRVDDEGRLRVPDEPVLPFIEGDGTGPDIWRATVRVLDAAVKRAYSGKRRIRWREVLAGEKAFRQTGEWLPAATLEDFRHYHVGIKGPLTTPVGGGIRSLNVALRQELDLYVCLRPVRHFNGVPSPVRRPQDLDVVIFRENTEDIYAGIEWMAGTPENARVLEFLAETMGVTGIRFPGSSSIGIKPISEQGSKRLVRAAIRYALVQGRRSVTLVHKGNIMKFTEGAFRDWGYALAREPELRPRVLSQREAWVLENLEQRPGISVQENARMVEPWFDQLDPAGQQDVLDVVGQALALQETHGGEQRAGKLLIQDRIADITLQQVLTRPTEFDVIATTNLNGDYISDALAAQVGGIGMAPGGNVNYETGHAVFEATHGTAPKYAGQDKVNPSSLILSGVLMLEHLGWKEAAEMIVAGIQRAIDARTVTYDLARLMRAEGRDRVRELKCSEFGDEIIGHMG